MAIPRQRFKVTTIDGKFIRIFHNYFLPLLNEAEALEEFCRFEGCENFNLVVEEIDFK
jgi:hypothetical protein